MLLISLERKNLVVVIEIAQLIIAAISLVYQINNSTQKK